MVQQFDSRNLIFHNHRIQAMFHAGRIGDMSSILSDNHGCSCCAHTAVGPSVSGSANVLINNRSALRVGDSGIHSTCCGANKWKAVRGAPHVLINQKRAHREGDSGMHCGGGGWLTTGSANVRIGDNAGTETMSPHVRLHWFELRLVHADGKSVEGAKVTIHAPDGQHLHEPSNGEQGHVVDNIKTPGKVKVTIQLSYIRRR
ncbi:MAG: PAAR domain-containing protein [Byssovorax sp.]